MQKVLRVNADRNWKLSFPAERFICGLAYEVINSDRGPKIPKLNLSLSAVIYVIKTQINGAKVQVAAIKIYR